MTALASRRIGSALASTVSQSRSDDERDQLLLQNEQLRARVSKQEKEIAYLRETLAATEAKLVKARRGRHDVAPAPAESDGKLYFEGEEVITQTQAAGRLGVDQGTVSRWVHAKKLKTVKVPWRRWPMIVASSL